MANALSDAGEIIADGSLGFSSKLAIHSKPISDIGVTATKFVEYRPTSDFSNPDSPIDFSVASHGAAYADYSGSLLYVRCQIKMQDGSDLPAIVPGDPIDDDSRVGVSNNFFNTLFWQVDCSLNGKTITNSMSGVPYVSYLNTILSYGRDAKATQLQSRIYAEDTPGFMQDINYPQSANEGFMSRSKLFEKSKSVEMVGPLEIPALKQQKYLLNNVHFKMRLNPTKANFRLLSSNLSPKYKVVINDIVLLVKTVYPSAQMLVAHNESLKVDGALAHYDYMENELRQHAIPSGSFGLELDDVLGGIHPTSMVIAFVKSAAVAGDYKENYCFFQHFNLNRLQVSVSGHDYADFTPNFAEDRYMHEYLSLFIGKHVHGQDFGGSITWSMFSSGYAIYVVDMQPSLGENTDSQAQFWPLKKKGAVRVKCQFASALEYSVNMLVLARYPTFFEIDQSRNIIMP
ncbi:MAG: hypothetical protein V3T76_09795 [candidate division NC10 bacterium]